MFQGCDSVGSNLSIQLGYVMACAWFALYFTAPWLTRAALQQFFWGYTRYHQIVSACHCSPKTNPVWTNTMLLLVYTQGSMKVRFVHICSIGFVLFFLTDKLCSFLILWTNHWKITAATEVWMRPEHTVSTLQILQVWWVEVMLSVEYSFAQTDAGWNPRGTAFEVLEVVAGMTSLCNLQILAASGRHENHIESWIIMRQTSHQYVIDESFVVFLHLLLWSWLVVLLPYPISASCWREMNVICTWMQARLPSNLYYSKPAGHLIFFLVFFLHFLAVVGLVALSLLLPSLIDAFLLRYLDSLVVGCGQPLLCPVLLRYVHGKGSAAMPLWRM